MHNLHAQPFPVRGMTDAHELLCSRRWCTTFLRIFHMYPIVCHTTTLKILLLELARKKVTYMESPGAHTSIRILVTSVSVSPCPRQYRKCSLFQNCCLDWLKMKFCFNILYRSPHFTETDIDLCFHKILVSKLWNQMTWKYIWSIICYK